MKKPIFLILIFVEIVKENQTPIGLQIRNTLQTYSSIVEIIHVDILQ
jgi:hypothetical protein